MALLELERVSKRYRRGERVALEDVSMVVEAGEMIAVWGERRSGRTTLLQIAAGIQAPSAGIVRFADTDLTDQVGLLGNGIAFCRTAFRAFTGRTILDQLTSCQLGRNVPRSIAQPRAWKALERVDAAQHASRAPEELNNEEIVRVAIARALVSEPQLLVIDEPTIGLDLRVRDGVLELLRSLADDGMAVLMSTSEGTGMLGADRIMTLNRGRLRGQTVPELAPVTDIAERRRAFG